MQLGRGGIDRGLRAEKRLLRGIVLDPGGPTLADQRPLALQVVGSLVEGGLRGGKRGLRGTQGVLLRLRVEFGDQVAWLTTRPHIDPAGDHPAINAEGEAFLGARPDMAGERYRFALSCGVARMVRTGRTSGEGGGDAPPVRSSARLSEATTVMGFMGDLTLLAKPRRLYFVAETLSRRAVRVGSGANSFSTRESLRCCSSLSSGCRSSLIRCRLSSTSRRSSADGNDFRQSLDRTFLVQMQMRDC